MSGKAMRLTLVGCAVATIAATCLGMIFIGPDQGVLLLVLAPIAQAYEMTRSLP